MKVYVTPSPQIHNIGYGSYGTEEARCRKVANLTAALLREAGIEVKIAPREWATKLGDSEWLRRVVEASNDFGADAHIAIHTDAGGKGAAGTSAWHYPGSTKGKALAEAIYKRVAEVSPGRDRGIRTSPVFYETRAARAPVCYLELAFHTDPKDAASVINDPEDYAAAIAEGVFEYAGIKPVPKPATPSAPALVAAADYPKLKNEFVQFMIRANNSRKPIRTVGCDGFSVLEKKWDESARTLAWRISGRLDGVRQTAQPTAELLRALTK